MEDNRKNWTQPQLIILGRGAPEENVLAGCKTKKLAALGTTKLGCRKGANCLSTKCSAISTTS